MNQVVARTEAAPPAVTERPSTGGLLEGIHCGLSEAAYHADPAMMPSASSHILRTMLQQSPDHARAAHPRLNLAYQADPSTDAKDRGTILHALVLGTPAPFRVLDVIDYKKDAARAQRDAAWAAGLIPVKVADMQELQDVAAAIRARLQAMPDAWAAMQDAIGAGMSEVTLIWRERGVLCRCRYDTLPAARFRASYDLKFTGLSAAPDEFGRKAVSSHGVQADLYPRAVKALRGDAPLFVMVACETEAPYGVTLHALAPDAADLARQKVDEALDLWAACLRSGAWPSYPPQIHYHGAKPWEVNAWDERQGRKQQFDPKPSAAVVARWNAFMQEGASL